MLGTGSQSALAPRDTAETLVLLDGIAILWASTNQHAGKMLTHRFLLKELWDELTDAQYLRVYVRQLRQKIEADPERPRFVLTETGIGYRLEAAD